MLFRRLNIVQLSSLSAAIFILAIGALLVKEVADAYHASATAKENRELVDLLAAFESVAHHHAVERGLTAGFLASGAVNQKQKVDAQRVKADEAETRLKQLAEESWPAFYELDAKLAPLSTLLQQKSQIRRQVDTQNGTGVFNYYSALNALALETLHILGILIEDPALIKEVNTAFLLASIKERTGQIRGKVNGAVSAQTITEASQNELQNWQADRAKYIGFIFSNNADRKASFSAVFSSSDSGKFSDIVDRVNQALPDFSSLPDSATWFPFATGVIASTKTLLDEQWQRVREKSTQAQARANGYIITVLIVTAILGSILVLLNLTLVKTLRTQLGILTSSLEQIADHGDLTINVALDSKNELGSVSRAVNKTISALRALVTGLDKSISTGTQLSKELDLATMEVVKEAELSRDKAESINEATEQISIASRQISESAADTLSFSRELERFASQALEHNDTAKSSIEALNVSMQSMETDATAMGSSLEKISNFLSTINSLADQTNLLALNAAIEAARAGEQGRGFAVVADEVRSLAGSSKQASDQISELLDELHNISQSVIKSIDDNTNKSKAVLEASDSASKSSQDVGSRIKQVEALSTTVATAAEEQSVSLDEVLQKVNEVLKAADHQGQLAIKLQQLFDDAKLNNVVLQRTMDGFKLEQ